MAVFYHKSQYWMWEGVLECKMNEKTIGDTANGFLDKQVVTEMLSESQFKLF